LAAVVVVVVVVVVISDVIGVLGVVLVVVFVTVTNRVVLGVIVDPEIQGDGGKQRHCAAPDGICWTHGHDVVVQLVVKQVARKRS
jgi:hypothetical protein